MEKGRERKNSYSTASNDRISVRWMSPDTRPPKRRTKATKAVRIDILTKSAINSREEEREGRSGGLGWVVVAAKILARPLEPVWLGLDACTRMNMYAA